jgi:hypothetical protein
VQRDAARGRAGAIRFRVPSGEAPHRGDRRGASGGTAEPLFGVGEQAVPTFSTQQCGEKFPMAERCDHR